MMKQHIPYVDALRGELVRAAHQNSPGKSRAAILRLVVGTTVAAVAIFSIVINTVVQPEHPARELALQIRQGDGFIQIAAVDSRASSSKMESELRAYGVDARVSTFPVSPSLVGRWEAIADREGGESTEQFGSLSLPHGWSGQLMLGRAAAPNENYTRSASALIAGEALHCQGIEQLPLDQTQRAVEELGFRSRWMELVVSEGGVRPGPDAIEFQSVDPPTSGTFAGATSVSDAEIILFVSLAPAELLDPRPSADSIFRDVSPDSALSGQSQNAWAVPAWESVGIPRSECD